MRNVLYALLAAVLTFAVTTPAEAQVPPRPVPVRPATPSRTVQVEVLIVHATRDSNVVDQRLSSLLPHLRHLDYTGFSVLSEQSESLQDGATANFPLVEDKEVRVDLVSHTDEAARLRFRVFKSGDKVLDTTVSVRRNRSFIVGGPEYGGGVLILPITARY